MLVRDRINSSKITIGKRISIRLGPWVVASSLNSIAWKKRFGFAITSVALHLLGRRRVWVLKAVIVDSLTRFKTLIKERGDLIFNILEAVAIRIRIGFGYLIFDI